MLKHIGNLLNLRNVMKRDPAAYKDEFLQQHRHFRSALEIFKVKPARGNDTEHFASLVEFMSHVAPLYKDFAPPVARELLELLSQHGEAMEPALRRKIVQALILLCTRNQIPREALVPQLFRLFAVPDKALRELLFAHMVGDTKRLSLQTNQTRVLNALHNFFINAMRDENRLVAKKALDVLVDLWRRGVWRTEKTVNAVATACFSKDATILTTALRFFLGVEDILDDDEDLSEREAAVLTKEAYRKQAGLKNAKRQTKRKRELKRMLSKIRSAEAREREEEEQGGGRRKPKNAAFRGEKAVLMVYDPQSFAERLFSQLKTTTQGFEVRLLMMNVVTRLVGAHKLILLGLYPFLQKYMLPHQKNVTQVLVFLAQASHDLVPPDVLAPCVKKLATEFVSDRSSSEVTTVGLNAIREVCARCPLAMEADLLRDLAQYKSSREKGIMMAARSLIAVFREVNPLLLHRRDRGKDVQQRIDEARVPEYGAQPVASDVEGAELLLLQKEAEAEAEREKREEEAKAEAETETARGEAEADMGDGGEEEEEAKEEEEEEEEDQQDDERGSDVMLGDDDEIELTEEQLERVLASGIFDGNGSEDEDEDDDEDESEEEEEGEECDDDEGEEKQEEDEAEVAEQVEAGDGEAAVKDAEDGDKQNGAAPATERRSDDSYAPVPQGSEHTQPGEATPTQGDAQSARPKTPIAATRIFTQEDFARIRALRKQRQGSTLAGKRAARPDDESESAPPAKAGRTDASAARVVAGVGEKEDEEDEEEDEEDEDARREPGEVPLDSITAFRKRHKMTREEKTEHVMDSRRDRPTFGRASRPRATTNREKKRLQPFVLVKHSKRIKTKQVLKFSIKQLKKLAHKRREYISANNGQRLRRRAL